MPGTKGGRRERGEGNRILAVSRQKDVLERGETIDNKWDEVKLKNFLFL